VKLITVLMPRIYLDALDDLIECRFYPNKAEAIRAAVRDLINREYFLTKCPGQNSPKAEV